MVQLHLGVARRDPELARVMPWAGGVAARLRLGTAHVTLSLHKMGVNIHVHFLEGCVRGRMVERERQIPKSGCSIDRIGISRSSDAIKISWARTSKRGGLDTRIQLLESLESASQTTHLNGVGMHVTSM